MSIVFYNQAYKSTRGSLLGSLGSGALGLSWRVTWGVAVSNRYAFRILADSAYLPTRKKLPLLQLAIKACLSGSYGLDRLCTKSAFCTQKGDSAPKVALFSLR